MAFDLSVWPGNNCRADKFTQRHMASPPRWRQTCQKTPDISVLDFNKNHFPASAGTG
jgi:hypothetical protein